MIRYERARPAVGALLSLLAAAPAAAWEFTPGLPCLLTHEEEDREIVLTYDPTQPLYSITVRRGAPLAAADVFSMRFDGPAGLVISTTRHELAADGRAITVTDRGFGNVLDGLQYNDTATAILGEAAVSFSLAGAADPVAAFRDCRGLPTT